MGGLEGTERLNEDNSFHCSPGSQTTRPVNGFKAGFGQASYLTPTLTQPHPEKHLKRHSIGKCLVPPSLSVCLSVLTPHVPSITWGPQGTEGSVPTRQRRGWELGEVSSSPDVLTGGSQIKARAIERAR